MVQEIMDVVKSLFRVVLVGLLLVVLLVVAVVGFFAWRMYDTTMAQEETYCYVSMSPPGMQSLNAWLHDLSHEYGSGVYIIEVAGEPDRNQQFYQLTPYADSVKLVCTENYQSAEIETTGNMNGVISDEEKDKLTEIALQGVAESESQFDWFDPYVTALIPYLEEAAE